MHETLIEVRLAVFISKKHKNRSQGSQPETAFLGDAHWSKVKVPRNYLVIQINVDIIHSSLPNILFSVIGPELLVKSAKSSLYAAPIGSVLAWLTH